MKRPLPLIVLATLLTLTAGVAAEPTPNSDLSTVQMAKILTFKKRQAFKVDYLLFLPKDYHARSKKKWPLILFLHGAGERGRNVWKVATHGPPKRVAQHRDFPFIVISPQCPQGQIWSEDALLGLLQEALRKYKVDASRVYLTGLSMGGYATWDLGLSHPEKFAAIVPICGGGELITVLLANGTQAEALKTLGIWAFHGGKDPVVPLEESQRLVDLLKGKGVPDVKLTVYPDAGHDAWTETYNNPELYDWLLRHHR